jgi:hypothetical protein
VAWVAWRAALAGVILVVAGGGAILTASIQGMALVPDGSIVDGYDVGLLPWMDVGSWLVPIGGVVAAVGAALTVWLGRTGPALRWLSIPACLVALFWVLLAAIGMAPRNGPDGSTSSSSLATFVYSTPANTIVFLLLPAAALVLLAALRRRGGRVPGSLGSS